MPPGRTESISAREAIRLLTHEKSTRAIDVRSEGEFERGSIPNFQNFPILDNEERHQVGCVYKASGQPAAIELGYALVADHRDRLVQGWRESLHGAEWPLLSCFRGGLRSEKAADWLRGEGTDVIRIEGGYKGLRIECLAKLDSIPELLIVAGPTGSGKTQLLQQSTDAHLDLEGMARHRGSAFGGIYGVPQPSQATFENEIAFRLFQLGETRLLVEDESQMIGNVQIPGELKMKMKESPVVHLTEDIETRARTIYTGYVAGPIENGLEPLSLLSQYESALFRIKPRLGGLLHDQIRQSMKSAFADQNAESHVNWIRQLLLNYYDRMYAFSFANLDRTVAFEGDWNACQNWIREQFV